MTENEIGISYPQSRWSSLLNGGLPTMSTAISLALATAQQTRHMSTSIMIICDLNGSSQ